MQAKKETKRVCYIGPTIHGVVSHGTVYVGGIPKVLEDEIKAEPAIGQLLIPLDRLAAVQSEVTRPTSAVAIIYKKAAAYAARKRG